MKWVNLLRRWTMHSIHAAVLSAALLGSASAAFAQLPAAPAAASNAAVQKHYSKSKNFDLPVRMERDFRMSLKEIRLYMKTPTTNWVLADSGPPSLERFSCKLGQDGEYWFTLATVDTAGRMTPADPSAEAPSQRVVVDSTPPVIQVQTMPVDGDLVLRCTVIDANPDPATLRAVCHTDIGDIALDAVPGQPGVYRVKGGEMLRHPVIVTAKDKAGNEGIERVNLSNFLSSTLQPPPPAPSKLPGEIAQVVNRNEVKDPPLPGGLGTDRQPARIDGPGVLPPKGVDFPPPPPPLKTPGTGGAPAIINDSAPKNLQPEAPSKIAGVPHRLINTNQASIDYRIEPIGPSGVGKVEIYMTPDQGQSWHRLAEDTVKRSPVEVRLPGDGVYGIRIVVSNGNGFGGKAPVRGDAPQCTIEVDTTLPFVALRSADLVPGAGHVEIRWNATDKNLGNEPVTLHYRTRPDAPWQVIARNVKNDGMYRWAFPRDAGTQFFFKIEVADQAGNVAHATSSQPVIIDMTEPRATVVGVSGSTLPH